MKIFCIALFAVLVTISSNAQVISAILPARLQVYGMKADGSDALMTSEQFMVLYDNLKLSGELRLSTLQTSDAQLISLLDSAIADRITVTGTIPEGSFMFHDALNEKFTVEAELLYGELTSRIILNYTVSNRNTSLANTFDITVTGSLSLKDDLGIVKETGINDKISFQFFQNIQGKTY